MQAFTFIFKRWFSCSRIVIFICLVFFTSLSLSTNPSYTTAAEEEDFSATPFTDYGDFNADEEEAQDALFFQHGRFFGIGLGTGTSGVTGNRGLLWEGGFPMLDFKLYYWFDLQYALEIGFFSASHFYDANNDHVDVNLINVGLNVKYYIDTKNLSAAISFANPYLSLGAGILYKTENSKRTGVSDPDSAFNMNIGGGFEFPVKHRRVYLTLDGKLRYANFKDSFSDAFVRERGISDLQGYFYTFIGSIVFTW